MVRTVRTAHGSVKYWSFLALFRLVVSSFCRILYLGSKPKDIIYNNHLPLSTSNPERWGVCFFMTMENLKRSLVGFVPIIDKDKQP